MPKVLVVTEDNGKVTVTDLTTVTSRQKVWEEVNSERIYQENKWGNEADDTVNTPWHWISFIAQYATKWMCGLTALEKVDIDLFRVCMIKVAAIAIAAVESVDRQRERNGKTFYEVKQ